MAVEISIRNTYIGSGANVLNNLNVNGASLQESPGKAHYVSGGMKGRQLKSDCKPSKTILWV